MQSCFKEPVKKGKVLVKYRIFMVTCDWWTDIDSNLGEILKMIPEKASAGLSADMLQLLLVSEIHIFLQISEKNVWRIY